MVRTSHRTINWFKVGKIVRHGTMDCSKLVKEYIKAVYCYPAYLIYRKSISCNIPGWMSYKMALRFLGEISTTSDRQMILKESFGPREENSSLKGPLLNHLTSEQTKHNFSYILMLQASCIYLGLNSLCPETYHPHHPPRRLIAPCPAESVISTEEYSNPSWLMFPLLLPQTSL